MKINYKHTDNEILVSLIGELDTPGTVSIQPDIDKLIELSNKTIKIDCAKLEYIASSGLRQIISLYKKCNENGGHLILTNVNADVYEIFCVTHFDKIFDIQ